MAKVLFGDAYDKSLHDQRDRLWHREKELEAEVERLGALVDESAEAELRLAEQVERLTALNRVSTENHRGLWVALRMVRDAIEEVGPTGILPNIEHEGIEPEQIAEHFVAAISRIAALAGEAQDG